MRPSPPASRCTERGVLRPRRCGGPQRARLASWTTSLRTLSWREEVHEALLHEGRSAADDSEDAVADRALVPALDRAHASLDRAQALDRILDPHRQAEQDETEPVAEVAGEGLIQRPQVERHERVDLVDLVAAIAQVPPHGAGDGRDDDVVDRGVERVPGPLHGRQRHRRPRDAVGHLRLALQGAARVRAGEQELREHAGVSFRPCARGSGRDRGAAVSRRLRVRACARAESAALAGRASAATREPRPASGDAPGANSTGSPSVSVSESITRPRAMPSAIAWCMRTSSAHPLP